MKSAKNNTYTVNVDMDREMAADIENRAAALQIPVEKFVNLVLLHLIEKGGRYDPPAGSSL
jgi:hypothetical protein